MRPRRPLLPADGPRGLGQLVEFPSWLRTTLIVFASVIGVSLVWGIVCSGPTRAATAEALKAHLAPRIPASPEPQKPEQGTAEQGKAAQQKRAQAAATMAELRRKALEYHNARRYEDMTFRAMSAGAVFGPGEYLVQVSIVSGEKRNVRYFRIQDAGCFRQPIIRREVNALSWEKPVL